MPSSFQLLARITCTAALSITPRSTPVRMDATVAATSIAGLDGKVVPTGAWENAPDRTAKTDKEKVVVLGSGWAAVKFVQNIDTSKMDVTVVSPRNFFLFTPFLPSVTVGTVESMRKLIQYESRPIPRQLKDKFDDITPENLAVS